jgi:hypothetical protein
MPIPISVGVRQLLEALNYVHLSTFRADGSPRNWVVWVGLEDDQILICTSDTVWKIKYTSAPFPSRGPGRVCLPADVPARRTNELYAIARFARRKQRICLWTTARSGPRAQVGAVWTTRAVGDGPQCPGS